MIITICILVFIYACFQEADADDRAYSERQKERRHEELMEIQERRLQIEKERQSEIRHRRTRTMARDERGRFVAQEVIEDYSDDYDEDYDEFDED